MALAPKKGPGGAAVGQQAWLDEADWMTDGSGSANAWELKVSSNPNGPYPNRQNRAEWDRASYDPRR
jgi:hypothetical protein